MLGQCQVFNRELVLVAIEHGKGWNISLMDHIYLFLVSDKNKRSAWI